MNYQTKHFRKIWFEDIDRDNHNYSLVFQTTNMNEDATKSSFWSVDEHRDNLNKCFRFLDVMEKITGTHFKNANPEMYNILKAVQSEL